MVGIDIVRLAVTPCFKKSHIITTKLLDNCDKKHFKKSQSKIQRYKNIYRKLWLHINHPKQMHKKTRRQSDNRENNRSTVPPPPPPHHGVTSHLDGNFGVLVRLGQL